MITALSFQALVFPPHWRARTRVVTAPATNIAPMKSIRRSCWIRSLQERLFGSEPSGGEALRRNSTAVTETPVLTFSTGSRSTRREKLPAMGRFMKKHLFEFECEVQINIDRNKNIPAPGDVVSEASACLAVRTFRERKRISTYRSGARLLTRGQKQRQRAQTTLADLRGE